jgi:RNA polymerase sigma-70 factor (ECF subfamily)
MASDPRVRIVMDLFETHYDGVFAFARRSVDASTAEDVAQEVFTRLLRAPDLEQREIRPGYLYRIAENLIRRRYNKERLFARHAPDYSAYRRDDTDSRPGRHAEQDDRSARWAVSQLDDRERQAVELVVCRGLSYRQAAESMGVKVSDVNNWRYRGVERLRRRVRETSYGRAE